MKWVIQGLTLFTSAFFPCFAKNRMRPHYTGIIFYIQRVKKKRKLGNLTFNEVLPSKALIYFKNSLLSAFMSLFFEYIFIYYCVLHINRN